MQLVLSERSTLKYNEKRFCHRWCPEIFTGFRNSLQNAILALLCGLIFQCMQTDDLSNILVEQRAIFSRFLKRYVIVDCYLPKNIAHPASLSLLLINDGQDLEDMHFTKILNGLLESSQIRPLLCVGIHANKYRKHEYGTAGEPDFAGRGDRAGLFQQFVLEELLPYLHTAYAIEGFVQKGYCGFSLGGLSAFDIAYHNPDVFQITGVFSGSLWWRSKDLGDGYHDDQHRIVHQRVRRNAFHPGQRYYLMTGSMDETADRNNNGIIDSIDDTLDLIAELKNKGVDETKSIHYINYEDGKHDVPSWGRAIPAFLLWGWPLVAEYSDMTK